MLRYFFVGGTAALVDWGVFALLAIALGVPWFPAAFASFLLATAVNYVLSTRLVFQSGVRFARHQEVVLVFLVSAVGLAVNQACMWILIEQLGLIPILAKVQATGVVFLWNYGARQHFIFAAQRR